jgi:VanZ family protein
MGDSVYFNRCYARIVRPYWLAITLFILFVITFLSLLPVDELPKVVGSDKLHHLLAYAGLMFWVALRKPKYWLPLLFLFMAWGGAIELIQPYVNRYAEWLDFLVNSVGLLLGVLVGFMFRKLLGIK